MAAGRTPLFRFKEDGTFEFTDAAGEGTYGIVEESGVLVVRDYDGLRTSAASRDPWWWRSPTALLTSMTHEVVQLSKK